MLPTQKSKGELFLASSLRDGLEDNDITQVKTLLLSKDADPNVLIPTQGIAPFHLVIGNDSETFAEEVTKLFLRHGGNPNVKSTDGMTPVHVAAAWGRISVLELLLANGGDPLSVDEDGRSPFHYAFDGGFYDAVAMLAKYCSKNEEEEEDEPKYKLTLDKILINKGNVVAEYVPSENSCSASVKTETSQMTMEFNQESKGTKVNDLKSLETASPATDNGSTNEFDHFNSNVTIRRNHLSRQKKCTVSNRLASEANLDITFSDRSVEEERLLIGKIINRLSNSFVNDPIISNDAITTSKRLIANSKTNNASAIKNTRSFLPLPKYHSYNLKLKKTPQRLADTSIISKSPNIHFPTKNDKTPTPSKRIGLSPRSYTCKSKYNNATPPSRLGKPNEVRIKSASSTPKRNQYRSRLYESTKLTKTQEKPKNVPSIKNITKTRTPLDKTYRKDQFGVLSYSPDTEVIPKNVDRKYLAKNIAVKLDDRMYDEHRESEPYEDSASDTGCEQTRTNSPLNNKVKIVKPLKNHKNLNKEITKGKITPNRCNILSSKLNSVSPSNFRQQKTPNKLIKSRFKQPATFETGLPKSDLKSEESREFDAGKDKNLLKTPIYDSPGSSKPVFSYLSENSELFEFKHETTINRDEENKLWMEMDEVCKSKCATPPASVSFLVKRNSQSSNNDSLDRDLGVGTSFYSDYSSGDLSTSDFYEAYHYGNSNPPVFPNARTMAESRVSSESFMSVEEEYLYEDAEEGVAFTERHLCVIPSSDREDKNDDKEKRSWVDRFEDLSIGSTATSSTVSPRTSFINSLLNDNILRDRLTALGEKPGPITKTTFDVYLKRLWRLERAGNTAGKQVQNPSDRRNEPRIDSHVADVANNIPDFLLSTDWTTKQQFYRDLEENAFKEYSIANSTRKYRGGISKTSFCYLLLDPRVTRDLPRTGNLLSMGDRWKRFLEGVFYVGKGKAARPAAHLYDAWGVWSKKKQIDTLSRKLRRILDIWEDGKGVVCLHVFSHTMLEEAFSREAAMIDALETVHLTNCNRGTYYGYTTTMSNQEKRWLGKYLLYKSMEIFMHEGERQLFPRNVIL